MADMLVKLYEFAPDLNLRRKLESKGFTVRRALPPERSTVLRWVAEEFGKEWADECAVAFARQPSTCFIALQEDGLAGFSCCEATCRDFFGPTGVRPDLRRQGLGKALLDYVGFAEYGLNVAAAFDVDESIVGTLESGKPILHISQLEQFCRDNKVLIGIITVPAAHAQEVCDLLVNNGIKAIWSFAPTHIDAPADILVQYENMATSLAVLSKHLSAQINGY